MPGLSDRHDRGLIRTEVARLCRGVSSSLTFQESIQKLRVVSRQAHLLLCRANAHLAPQSERP
jgi:hypothetical protein